MSAQIMITVDGKSQTINADQKPTHLFEDQKDVLVYHMWTQFYIDEQWVNLDSALGLVMCPADRITFSVDSLEEDTIASVLPLVELINNLKVTVQTVE